jgi:hypothetical protein
MRLIAAATPLALLLCGCPASPFVTGWDGVYNDSDAANCLGNSPPFIANVEMNSFPPAPEAAASGWAYTIHFDWADPGVAGATDVPNIELGSFSHERQGVTTPDYILDELVLTTTCINGVNELGDLVCAGSGHGMAGCSAGSLETCTQGELTYGPVTAEDVLFDGQDIEVRFRVYDRCGLSSNEKVVQYTIGNGLQSESAAADDGGDEA